MIASSNRAFAIDNASYRRFQRDIESGFLATSYDKESFLPKNYSTGCQRICTFVLTKNSIFVYKEFYTIFTTTNQSMITYKMDYAMEMLKRERPSFGTS
jgi:hypothetical protein